MSKKVLMIIASKNFRDPEYYEPKKVLEEKGIEVITASSAKRSTGVEGGVVDIDILLKDTKTDDYDAVVFIGGAGSSEYFNDKKAQQLAKDAVAQGKVLGAICAAVSTIANAGTLKGKKATCFAGVADTIKAGGANYTAEGVTVDGKVVTADGPRSASAFGTALVKSLLN